MTFVGLALAVVLVVVAVVAAIAATTVTIIAVERSLLLLIVCVRCDDVFLSMRVCVLLVPIFVSTFAPS